MFTEIKVTGYDIWGNLVDECFESKEDILNSDVCEIIAVATGDPSGYAPNEKFNHYAAIKEMERLGLV